MYYGIINWLERNEENLPTWFVMIALVICMSGIGWLMFMISRAEPAPVSPIAQVTETSTVELQKVLSKLAELDTKVTGLSEVLNKPKDTPITMPYLFAPTITVSPSFTQTATQTVKTTKVVKKPADCTVLRK